MSAGGSSVSHGGEKCPEGRAWARKESAPEGSGHGVVAGSDG